MSTAPATPLKRQSLTWRRLVALAASADLALLLAQGVARQDAGMAGTLTIG
jgi:hypothetical protein